MHRMHHVPTEFWPGVGQVLLTGTSYRTDSQQDPDFPPDARGMSGHPGPDASLWPVPGIGTGRWCVLPCGAMPGPVRRAPGPVRAQTARPRPDTALWTIAEPPLFERSHEMRGLRWTRHQETPFGLTHPSTGRPYPPLAWTRVPPVLGGPC